MQTNNFSARLREERERIGLSQAALAEAGGVKKLAQHTYEKGERSPSSDYLLKVADAGVDVSYLLTGSRKLTGPTPPPSSDEDAISLPLLSATGSMGPGNEVTPEDVILGRVPVSRHWLSVNLPRSRPEALQLVHAYGDSMGDTLRSGDFAIVDTDYTVADVSGVYVLQANGQLYIKRVSRRLDGRHEITSDNPNVRTVEVLDGSHPVRICGRVVFGWNGRRF